MAKNNHQRTGSLGFEAKLWEAADLLRNNMDPAEYKHVVLGLLFLKYIEDAFEERRDDLRAIVADPESDYYVEDEDEREAELSTLLEDRDEYTAENVFWVPEPARWTHIRGQAKQPTIGKTISEFPLRALGEVTTNFDCQRIPVRKNDRKPGPYPYYGASGVADYVHDYIFDGEYLLIAEDGENLRTRNSPIAFMATGRFWVNNHAHIVQGNGHASTRFLCYALQDYDITPYLSGSTRPKLTQRELNRIVLPCLPLDEQRRIVAVLGALDDKIELNRRMNRTLEAMAQAIFKSWFIDFDSVPDSEMVESELGPIPKGWSVGSVSDVADLNPAVWSRKTAPPLVRYLDLRNVKWGMLGDYTEYPYSEAPSRARRILAHGDTLIGTVRPANGSYGMVLNPPPFATGSTGFAVLRPKTPELIFFCYLWLTQREFIVYLASVARGSAYPAVSADIIHGARMAMPPSERLAAFHEVVLPLMDRKASNEGASRTLAALRDALLPKLISGEIRVPEAEAAVMEVA